MQWALLIIIGYFAYTKLMDNPLAPDGSIRKNDFIALGLKRGLTREQALAKWDEAVWYATNSKTPEGRALIAKKQGVQAQADMDAFYKAHPELIGRNADGSLQYGVLPVDTGVPLSGSGEHVLDVGQTVPGDTFRLILKGNGPLVHVGSGTAIVPTGSLIEYPNGSRVEVG